MKVADTAVYTYTTQLLYSSLTTCKAHLNGLCYVLTSSILNSSEPNNVADTATPWTARVRVNASHMSASSHVKLRRHSFYHHKYLFPSQFLRLYTCLYTTPFFFNNKTSMTYTNLPFQKEKLKTFMCMDSL